jgi:hypothetical protein
MKATREDTLKTNITKNLRTIEELKAELVDGVSSLFKAMIPNHEKKIINSLVRLILASYLLARRLGISYARIEQELQDEVRDLIEGEHDIEEWFGDLSELQKHLQKQRN